MTQLLYSIYIYIYIYVPGPRAATPPLPPPTPFQHIPSKMSTSCVVRGLSWIYGHPCRALSLQMQQLGKGKGSKEASVIAGAARKHLLYNALSIHLMAQPTTPQGGGGNHPPHREGGHPNGGRRGVGAALGPGTHIIYIYIYIILYIHIYIYISISIYIYIYIYIYMSI